MADHRTPHPQHGRGLQEGGRSEPGRHKASSSDDSFSGLNGLLAGIDGNGKGGGKLALSGDELLVYNAVDGKKTCQQIVECTPLHDFAVCRTLLDLMDRDVVALTDVKGSATRAKSGGQGGAPGLVLMGVALLAALFGTYRNFTSPFGILGLPPLIQPAVDTAREARVWETLEAADARVRGFRLAYGRMPASMDELVSEGVATKASVEGIALKATNGGYRLEMPGPEGPLHIDRRFAVMSVPPPEPAPSPSPAALK